MPDPRWEIERTDAGYHTRLYAADGEMLMSSEVLNRREDALNNVRAVQDAVLADTASGIEISFTDHRAITS